MRVRGAGAHVPQPGGTARSIVAASGTEEQVGAVGPGPAPLGGRQRVQRGQVWACMSGCGGVGLEGRGCLAEGSDVGATPNPNLTPDPDP